jgi:ABC-2 type transport system ATP-binding protein
MSAMDHLQMKCLAMGVRSHEEPETLLTQVGLADTGKKKVKHFSMGMKQRLGLALSLVGNPDLVILDEPINGLDPQGIVEIREIIEELNHSKKITFMISSHILEELSKIATDYGIIHGGQLLQELTQEELLAKCTQRIELSTSDNALACTVLEAMGITKYRVEGSGIIHIQERLDESGEIVLQLAKQGIRVHMIQVKNEALEDYYLNLTSS